MCFYSRVGCCTLRNNTGTANKVAILHSTHCTAIFRYKFLCRHTALKCCIQVVYHCPGLLAQADRCVEAESILTNSYACYAPRNTRTVPEYDICFLSGQRKPIRTQPSFSSVNQSLDVVDTHLAAARQCDVIRISRIRESSSLRICCHIAVKLVKCNVGKIRTRRRTLRQLLSAFTFKSCYIDNVVCNCRA